MKHCYFAGNLMSWYSWNYSEGKDDETSRSSKEKRKMSHHLTHRFPIFAHHPTCSVDLHSGDQYKRGHGNEWIGALFFPPSHPPTRKTLRTADELGGPARAAVSPYRSTHSRRGSNAQWRQSATMASLSQQAGRQLNPREAAGQLSWSAALSPHL